jgi:hypothetical protein
MLSPGESWTFRIDVVRKAGARSRDDIDVKVVARSRLSTSDRDVVWFRVRAR